MLLSDIAAHADARLHSPLPTEFWETYEQDRARAFEISLQPIAGAAQAVRAVKSAGINVRVASQGKLEKTELTLALTGLRELFDQDALFSAYDVPRGKPFPDLFLHAAASMDVPVQSCVVVEDTTIGVKAAAAAGMRVIQLVEHSDPGPMEDLGATRIRSLGELAPLLSLVQPSR